MNLTSNLAEVAIFSQAFRPLLVQKNLNTNPQGEEGVTRQAVPHPSTPPPRWCISLQNDSKAKRHLSSPPTDATREQPTLTNGRPGLRAVQPNILASEEGPAPPRALGDPRCQEQVGEGGVVQPGTSRSMVGHQQRPRGAATCFDAESCR